MAKFNLTNNTVTVEERDTLSAIAAEYSKKIGKTVTYQQIANWNNLSNPNLIRIGQVLKLSKSGSSSTSTTAAKTGLVVSGPGMLSTSNTEVMVSWTWNKESTTESYKVVWEYQVPNKAIYTGETATVTVDHDYPAGSRYHVYTLPTEAIVVRVKIKPIAKKKKDDKGNETSTALWTEGWSKWYEYRRAVLANAPSAPSVEIKEGNMLKASFANLNKEEIDSIKFQIVKNDSTTVKTSEFLKLRSDNGVSWEWKVDAGNEYKVRAKSFKWLVESDWSPFSENVRAYPSKPSFTKDPKAAGKDTASSTYSVALEWSKIASAETYDIQHTSKKEYFDNPTGDVDTVNTEQAVTKLTIHKLSGGTRFFRVRAVNEKGTSDWSAIKSINIGEVPAAPTTWSSSTTAIVGEPLNLYWVHNSKDGSEETSAEISLNVGRMVDGEFESLDTKTFTIKNDGRYRIPAYTASGNVVVPPSKAELIEAYKPDEVKDSTRSCPIDTSGFSEGIVIKWQVRTAGITNAVGDNWSIQRTIDVYAKPNLELTVTDNFEIAEDGTLTLLPPEDEMMDTLRGFPFYMKAVAGPSTQTPIGYHVSITANSAYETVDRLGNDKTVVAGEELYSKYFDVSTVLLVEFSASNLDLENGISYTITCTVSMNSGLTDTKSQIFSVDWTESHYAPNAEITIDTDIYSASIRPYCEERHMVYRKVNLANGVYTVSDETLDEENIDTVYTSGGETVYMCRTTSNAVMTYSIAYINAIGNPIEPTRYVAIKTGEGSYTLSTALLRDAVYAGPVRTDTGEEVLLGIADGKEFYYCLYEEVTLVEDVTLAVYRREFDGGFTEIATNLSNAENVFVTDPHPALDLARYRIVATSKANGAVSFYDLPGIPVGGKAAVIQWDEAWSSFDGWSENTIVEAPWAGSMLKLPYNIDVSDSNNSDVSLVEYIGRKHPVTYHGTQLGETSSWSVEIPKDDEETLYGLRRLALWMGDVYVREPSGTGYWANVKVSFSINHLAVTIPVNFSMTRVEGGI